MRREELSSSERRRETRRWRALGTLCVLAMSALSLACGSSGGGSTEPANEWDTMEWDAGSWAERLTEEPIRLA